MPVVLTMNGLTMPDDFPGEQFNRISARVMPLASSRNDAYVEFAAAWNALAYRYRAMVDHGDAFTASIIADGTSPPADRRYHQEQCLFDFFSSGFSALDSFFYAAFAVGTCVDPVAFPLVTDKDRRNVSCEKTVTAYMRRFRSGQLLTALQALANSAEHANWRNVRNVLTHRAAPGRTLHVSFGADDETPVDTWKPFDIPLDRKLTADRRAHLSGLLGPPMTALAEFAEAHL